MPDLRSLLAAPVLALLWLTRLPVGRFLPRPAPTLQSALWAFPVAGMVVGALAGLVLVMAWWLGLPPVVAALLAVGAQVWLTGGLHEDGLADFADGMGGRTIEKRLEIMRDSRIGSYGALTLGLVMALRVAALAALEPVVAIAALVSVAAFSRAGIVLALYLLPPARSDGLGRGAGRPSRAMLAATLAVGFAAFVVASFCDVWPVGILVIAAPLSCLAAQGLVEIKAQQKLGGQTGDVLGAVQQAGEVAALLAIAALAGETP